MAESGESSHASHIPDNHASASEDEADHLKDLIAQATAKYAMKDYNAAAELYAFATELQADLNGEMASANADLLYAYGRCLYHVAVKKSDVLGLSKTSGSDPEASRGLDDGAGRSRKQTSQLQNSEKSAEDAVGPMTDEQKPSTTSNKQTEGINKPYFQFNGDENFDASDDEEAHDSNDSDDEDAVEEDDFSIAYEVLDLARLLLQKREIEIEKSHPGKDKEEHATREIRQNMERLADTYDLQAEISLEGEKFPAAVADLKSALELKIAIYPPESSVIAEAHYKLSLALEFASVTEQKDEQNEATSETHVDEGMREEAARELEAAISSCKLRIQKEEAKLEPGSGIDEVELKDKTAQIEDVKDMVKELSQRLVEIRQSPLSIRNRANGEIVNGDNPVAGLLGSILGESPANRKAKLEEASQNAHDLTSLIKKKKAEPKVASDQANGGGNDSMKRKLDNSGESESGTEKKARIADADSG